MCGVSVLSCVNLPMCWANNSLSRILQLQMFAQFEQRARSFSSNFISAYIPRRLEIPSVTWPEEYPDCIVVSRDPSSCWVIKDADESSSLGLRPWDGLRNFPQVVFFLFIHKPEMSEEVECQEVTSAPGCFRLVIVVTKMRKNKFCGTIIFTGFHSTIQGRTAGRDLRRPSDVAPVGTTLARVSITSWLLPALPTAMYPNRSQPLFHSIVNTRPNPKQKSTSQPPFVLTRL